MIWLEIAWRNLWRNPSRSVFAVLVACTGVTAVLLSLGYMLSAFHAVREGTIHGGLGHLQVAHPEEFGGYSDRPMQHGLEPGAVSLVTAVLARLEGGAIMLPRLEFQGVASSGDRSVIFVGEGVEPNEERRLNRHFVLITAGAGLERTEDVAHRAVIGEEMARLLGVELGDSITLMAPTAESGLNAVDADVVGLVTTGNPVLDRTRVVVPLALAQSLVRTERVSRLVLGLEATGDTERVQQALAPQLAGLQVRSWSELAVFYHQLVDLYARQFAVLGVIIFVVVVLTFSNTILMGVLERTREIGTLLALGIDRRNIRLQFVLEGLLLGTLGSLAGGTVSAILVFGINALRIPMPPPPGQTLGYPLHFMFDLPAAFAVGVVCIGLGALSAFLASRRVSGTRPLQALNHA